MNQFWIGLDQWINTWFGGWADETISARVYRKQWTLVEKFINLLFWNANHCKEAYYSELMRRQLPWIYRNGK